MPALKADRPNDTWESEMVALETEALPSLRVEVVNAGARLASDQYALLRVAAELDESGEWAYDGVATCAHWIADALDVEVCTAREWLRIGHLLAKLPAIDEAFASRELSYSKVRSLTRLATPENEQELCDIARRVPAGWLTHALAAWLARQETPGQTERRQQAAQGLRWKDTVEGMLRVTADLAPADAAVFRAMVDAKVMSQGRDASADASERWESVAHQRVRALMSLLREGGGDVVTEVVLHVRSDGCTLDDGTPIPETVVERIAPTSFIRALIHDAESKPINASGRHRHPTARQQRVVRERDGGRCVDCGSTELLQFDHVPDFDESHRTVVDELQDRCRRCHDRRHRKQKGWL
jgi:hypothetical protein